MPPVPAACQQLDNDVIALEQNDQQLRTTLAGLTGAAAWSVLSQIADGREQLAAKRKELAACILANSAAIQANLVVMDVAASGPLPASRTAQLWDVGPATPTAVESAPVAADSIALNGPLPASFAVTVSTTGDPDIIGPDFRSSALQSAPQRVEVLLGPTVQITCAELEAALATLLPYTTQVDAGGKRIDVNLLTCTVSGAPGRLTATVGGQATASALGLQNVPFSGKVSLGLVPSSAPAMADIVHLVKVDDVALSMPGILGALISIIVPFMKTSIEGFATEQLRTILRTEVPKAVQHGFVLAGLPPDVTLSMRKVSLAPDGISFQPALGAVGTTLSTFSPPNLGNP
jgi:hypothetical protein